MRTSDRKLLRRMHRGHEASARALWQRLAPRMLTFARSIVGSGGEDVVQSVFMSVLREPRGTILRVEDPAAWLLVLTRRAALNALRAARREAGRIRGTATQPQPIREPVCNDSLSRAVGSLPRRLREVVVLRHFAGLTFDQVAVALGDNRNTAAARYREAIRRLRLALGEEDSEASGLLAAGSTP